jgi:predicted PurR-regulated permease PerM
MSKNKIISKDGDDVKVQTHLKMKTKIPTTRDITHTILAVLCIGALIAANFWVLRPFLISLIWASVIVIATWPVLLMLEARLVGRRGLAVAVMTLVILLIVFIPVTLAVLTIVHNAENITAQVQSLSTIVLPLPPDWLEHIPIAGKKLAARWSEFAVLGPDERTAMVAPHVRTILQWFMEQAGSIGMTMIYFILTVIIATIMYAKGEVVSSGILRFTRRLAGQDGEDVAILAAKAVRGVALGVVLTAVIQAALAGIGLAIAGVPAAALLTAVVFMLCLAQIGPALVLVPAIIWLYWKGDPLWGTVLLVISLVAVTMDNVIRPVLIKKGADLPLIMIFTGVIGGLLAFGIIGLFIGPVVLAVTYTLLKAWVSGSAQEEEKNIESE